jgi:hypothetical protein
MVPLTLLSLVKFLKVVPVTSASLMLVAVSGRTSETMYDLPVAIEMSGSNSVPSIVQIDIFCRALYRA